MMTAKRTVRCNAPFEGILMGSSTAQYLHVELSGSHYPLDSLIHPREPGTNQRGLLYGPVISKSIWASGFNLTIWPILYLSPGLKPPLGLLNEWSSLIHTTLHLLDHIQWSASRTRKWLLDRITSRLLGIVGEYHYRAYLLKWEPFPKPLSPHPTPT